MTSFPTVATVIGVSQEVAESGPLLATLAIDPSIMAHSTQSQPSEPMEIKAADPVTQAVVDNIIGKLPTKKEPVLLKCEICNVTVSSEEILQTHYAGAKHARKVKGQELIKALTNSPDSAFVATYVQNGLDHMLAEFTCKICNVRVNSYQQLQQHLTGSKHKNKAEANKSNTMEIPVPGQKSGDKGVANVDIRPNRLYCAACEVHVNSDLQLHQHITSSKHANKVNGRAPAANKPRGTPYARRPARSLGCGAEAGENQPQWNSQQHNNRQNTGWSPSNSGLGLSGNFSQQMGPNKPFVPGGVLYSRR